MKNETIEILRTFSHPIRLRAMELLARKPRTIDELTEELPIERASVDAHIRMLRNNGLLKTTSGGRPDGEMLHLPIKAKSLMLSAHKKADGIAKPTPPDPGAGSTNTSRCDKVKSQIFAGLRGFGNNPRNSPVNGAKI